MKIVHIFFLFIFFLFLHCNCQAGKYDLLVKEIESKITPHLAGKPAPERYDIGVSLRKGNPIFR